MTITTNFNIGDSHYFMQNNAVQSRTIMKIDIGAEVIDSSGVPTVTKYYTLTDGQIINEVNVINSKAALLSTL